MKKIKLLYDSKYIILGKLRPWKSKKISGPQDLWGKGGMNRQNSEEFQHSKNSV
jgi:hypothetical protein